MCSIYAPPSSALGRMRVESKSTRCQADSRYSPEFFLHILTDQSGTPALRKPAKYVVSNKARTFGTPKKPVLVRRAMLE